VRLVNRLIAEAVRLRASDIHIETAEPPRPVRVRLRVDGELVPHLEVPAQYRFALVARLKIMAELDISEHRKPQDGKIDFARFGGPQGRTAHGHRAHLARAGRRGAAPAVGPEADAAGRASA
jgi:Tfp pilus assembly pilus retraction ATPase PilT